MGPNDDRIKDFLSESHENLDQLDRDLVALEKDPGSRNLLAGVFRVIHTIKGTCGFFGFSRLEQLTHAAEEVLSRLRDSQLSLDPGIMSALLSTVDAVRRMLSSIEASRSDGDEDHRDLIQRLGAFLDSRKEASDVATVADVRGARESPKAPSTAPSSGTDAAHGPGDGNIRVDVGVLDKLMNLVGELVLTRNQVLQLTRTQTDKPLLSTCQHLNLITRQLQDEVMKTRLQRIGTLWDRLPRIVRDLAMACGKQVRLEVEGEGTELDKSIIEAIRDPLIHLLRNSIDHGIEAPSARAAVGKLPEGCVHLRAFHENGQVMIEVQDDGAGIDLDRVRRKALATGRVPPERIQDLTDREAIELIFLPGFSTAETVTNVSGRGVGLDVVKTNLEKIGGAIKVETRPGQGVKFSLRIPLTLTIVPALIVTTGGERFAIPLIHLLKLVRLEPNDAGRAIEMVQEAPVYRLRGKLLPIVHLRTKLKMGVEPGLGEKAQQDGGAMNLVVLEAEGRQFGLLVDRIHDTEEIVVKPLGKRLQPLSVFAGATVMGDGKAALILDIPAIAKSCGLDHVAPGSRTTGGPAPAEAIAQKCEKLLLLKGSSDTLFAVLLHRVERLEQIPRSRVERLGKREVLQYRGAILPLVYLDDLVSGQNSRVTVLPASAAPARTGPLRVVISNCGGKSAGLVAEEIIDIVEETLAIQPLGARRGVLGSMVIQGRAAEVVDFEEIARIADPSTLEAATIESLADVCHA